MDCECQIAGKEGGRVKCRNCKHEIIELSPLLNANRRYAHFTEKFGATMVCAVSKCKCSIA